MRRPRFRWRLFALCCLALLVVALGTATVAWRNAVAAPVVRRLGVALPRWPAGARPITAVLISDLHVGNLVTGQARLHRIVDQVDALHPDLILIAGDFIAGYGPGDAAHAAPALRAEMPRLHAPLGVVAVLGNHDIETDPALVRRILGEAGVTVLDNAATRRGPIAIAGLGDQFTGRANPARTLAAVDALLGARVMLAHSPDIAPLLPDDITLVLAGHMHCGQVVLPWIGPPTTVSLYGDRYRCGLIREGGRLTVVGAGTGTSQAPLRWNAPPDLWLLTLGPAAAKR